MRRIGSFFVALILLVFANFGMYGCQNKGYTETIPFEEGGTRLIAHRGLSGIYTENTAGAFRGAAAKSYYGIETDVRRTGDGQFVLIHDETPFRLGGGGKRAEETSLADLLATPLHDKSGENAAVYLATLEEYLAIAKQAGKRCFLELKSDFTPEEIERIIGICGEAGNLDSVTFISFHYDDLLCVRALLPTAEVQFLTSSLDENTVMQLIEDGIDVSVKHTALDNKETVDMLHSYGISVGAWTVDDVDTAARLRDFGVDYITTNILE